MELLPSGWTEIFAPESPLFELVARGSLLYLGIVVLMRFMPRRTGGELATMDLIFVVLVAEAGSHSLGDYTSVVDGLFVILTLMAWNYVVNALSYHVPFIERFFNPRPLLVVRNGRLLRRNMRQEFLTEEELISYLRQQGIDDVKDVKAAYVEPEGKITAIKRKR